MGRITVELLRKRSEHNDGVLSTLQEIGLHQQGLEKIETLGQLCRQLRILYLQANVIGKLENLHRLKDLEHLNIAINNITKVQNLQHCESLKKLDLTANFIDKAALPTLQSLRHNLKLQELHLLGNPCTKWDGYRTYVVASIPQLKNLDGQKILASEHIAARQNLSPVTNRLLKELADEGVDVELASAVEDDSIADLEEIPETGYLNERGEMVRPWCPATRLLDQRETERENARAEASKRAGMGLKSSASCQPKRHEDFPLLQEGAHVMQCNEGKWDFVMNTNEVDDALVLDVAVSPYLDTSLIKVDIQPCVVRVLIKGRLLQLCLPHEVKPDSGTAQRSTITSHLVVTMPLFRTSGSSFDVNCSSSAVPMGPGKQEKTVAVLTVGRVAITNAGTMVSKQKPAHGKGSPVSATCRASLSQTAASKPVAIIEAVDLDDDDVPQLQKVS